MDARKFPENDFRADVNRDTPDDTSTDIIRAVLRATRDGTAGRAMGAFAHARYDSPDMRTPEEVADDKASAGPEEVRYDDPVIHDDVVEVLLELDLLRDNPEAYAQMIEDVRVRLGDLLQVQDGAGEVTPEVAALKAEIQEFDSRKDGLGDVERWEREADEAYGEDGGA